MKVTIEFEPEETAKIIEIVAKTNKDLLEKMLVETPLQAHQKISSEIMRLYQMYAGKT